MTTLAIIPNWKNKGAKFRGTVAAGEHVSVTIQNDDGEGGEFIADASTLRLRVVDPCNGRTLAIFPEPVPEGETPETWDSDLSPLRCTLNLNTVQMLKAVPPAANVSLLFVLDDYDNNTLYFKEQFEVTHWPRLRGEEEPTDLDNYKDIIADFNTRLDGYDSRITAAENAAQAATGNASTAAAKANQAVDIANQAVDKAETAQNSAAASAEAALDSALAAEEAQEAAESAAESINSPDATLSEAGVAADAKATGDAIADEETRATAAEAAEETRAKGVESGLRTDLTAAQKAINDEAVLRATADADLEANKADKATTYTKTETDAKIARFVDGAEYVADYGTPPKPTILLKHGTTVVGTVDATDFVIDGMVSSVEIEDGNLVITFNTDAGQEPIEIPLTDIFNPDNYYNKTAADGKFVAKEAGKGLSTEDYTTTEKTKLAGIEAGAEVNDELAPAYSQTPAFTNWTFSAPGGMTLLAPSAEYSSGTWTYYENDVEKATCEGDEDAVSLEFDCTSYIVIATRTRTDLVGYQLGNDTTHLLATAAQGAKADAALQPSDVANSVTKNGTGPVKSSGIWSAIWGALSALPTGFSSLYDWVVDQLAGKQPSLAPGAIVVPGVIKTVLAAVKRQGSTVILALPTSGVTVNGKALSSDVTLTGADIPVDATQGAQKIDAALAGKASTADATLNLRGPNHDGFSAWAVTPVYPSGYTSYTGPTWVDAQSVWVINFTGHPDYPDIGEMAAGPRDSLSLEFLPSGTTATRTVLEGYMLGDQYAKPLASEAEAEALRTGKANASDLLAKLDSTSAAPAFSSDSSTQYPVGSHCTYNGKLYKCTTATTGGTWVAGSWTADTMTDPDAVLDVTSQNQLRVVAKDGTLLWAQGYDLASTSSATLACDAVNNFTFADGATSQAFALPTAPTGKVGDFGLDIDNSANTGAATMTLTGLDTTFSAVVPEGESLNDMLAIAAGELARFYITLSTFRVNNLPTWHIVKQIVENGGATA